MDLMIEDYDHYRTVEIDTENIDTNKYVQSIMFNYVKQLALEHGFTNAETSYFYLFKECCHESLFQMECDVLDKSQTKIAIECYLYLKNTNQFIAKSFAVFKK